MASGLPKRGCDASSGPERLGRTSARPTSGRGGEHGAHSQDRERDQLPDGGPLSITVTGKRNIDIGRDSHLDWTLPDPTRFISSKHCEVRYRDGGYWLHDVSTNGTFLNGGDHRMQAPHRLRTGDRFTIGHYIIAARGRRRAGRGASGAGGARRRSRPIRSSGPTSRGCAADRPRELKPPRERALRSIPISSIGRPTFPIRSTRRSTRLSQPPLPAAAAADRRTMAGQSDHVPVPVPPPPRTGRPCASPSGLDVGTASPMGRGGEAVRRKPRPRRPDSPRTLPRGRRTGRSRRRAVSPPPHARRERIRGLPEISCGASPRRPACRKSSSPGRTRTNLPTSSAA